MKNAVAVFEQLPKQYVVTSIALDKLQFVTRRAPGQIVDLARAQVVEDHDLIPAPAEGFGQVRPNESRSTCDQRFQDIAAAKKRARGVCCGRTGA
jgi:hypothetical protein